MNYRAEHLHPDARELPRGHDRREDVCGVHCCGVLPVRVGKGENRNDRETKPAHISAHPPCLHRTLHPLQLPRFPLGPTPRKPWACKQHQRSAPKSGNAATDAQDRDALIRCHRRLTQGARMNCFVPAYKIWQQSRGPMAAWPTREGHQGPANEESVDSGHPKAPGISLAPSIESLPVSCFERASTENVSREWRLR